MYGVCGMIIQFLLFPPAARRYGVLNCLKAVTITFPIAYLLTPFTALLPNQLAQQIGIVAIMLVKCWASIFAFPCSTILLTNSASSLRILGTLNGVSTSISALGRASGPAIGGWTFSYGVDHGYVILPWWTLAAFAVLGAIPVWWLVEMEGFGGGGDSGSENDLGEPAEDIQTDDEEVHGLQAMALKGDPPSKDSTEETLATTKDISTKDVLSAKHPVSCKGGPGHDIPSRRLSSPIGFRESVGPGGGSKLSNGLGHSHSGLGSGGTYH